MHLRPVARVALLGALAAPSALAQPRDAPAAEALFQSARAAMQAGKLDEACARFAESFRIDAAAGTQLNLAACEEKRGRLADAWEHYRTLAQALPPRDDRLPFVTRQIDALAKRLPRLTIRLAAGAPPGSKVTRDGVEVGAASLGERLPLNPGEHTVSVTAPGFRDRTLLVRLSESEIRELEASPGEPVLTPAPAASAAPPVAATASAPPAAASAPAPSPTAAPSLNPAPPLPPIARDSSRNWGYVLAGGGAFSLALGAATGAFAIERRGVVRDHCSGVCDDEGLKAAGDFRTLSLVSTIAFAVGALGLGTGGYLIWAEGSGRSAQVAVAGQF